MNTAATIHQVLDFVGPDLDSYPRHILGCIVLWGLLSWLTPVNRVAAFVFAFSAWFVLFWALQTVSVTYQLPIGPGDIAFVLIFGTPLLLFGYCAISSPLWFGAPRDIDTDADRFLRWAWFLVPAHIVHVLLLSLAMVFAAS